MEKATFVGIPGAWHGPAVYHNAFRYLEKKGHPTIAMDLPSIGAFPAHADFHGDVQGICSVLENLIEVEEKEVVLISHSYSGMPATEAPIGLGKKERQAKGLKGGVIRLVYIMAFVMPEGFQPTAGGAKETPPQLGCSQVTASYSRSCSCRVLGLFPGKYHDIG